MTLLVITFSISKAQVSGNTAGGRVINTVTTAVPFLRIAADARSGGMGDVGLATPIYGNGENEGDLPSSTPESLVS